MNYRYARIRFSVTSYPKAPITEIIRNEHKNSLLLLGGRWKVLIIRELMPEVKRFGELQMQALIYRRGNS